MNPDSRFEVFDESAEGMLKEIGNLLRSAMPPTYGFVFLMTELGPNGNVFYTSSVQRDDVIRMMQNFILKYGDAAPGTIHVGGKLK